MATEAGKETKSKKGLPTAAVVAIGCVGILVLASIVMTVVGKTLFSKFGAGLVQKGIEAKTGVKMDVNEKSGSMTFTDSKTGQKVAVGEQKIPDNFPKDFPVYTGAKLTGTVSGTDNKEGSVGMWVVFSTPDSIEKVKAFYDTELTAKGWTLDETMTINTANTWSITKGTLQGAVMASREGDDTETNITVTLGTKDTETTSDGE